MFKETVCLRATSTTSSNKNHSSNNNNANNKKYTKCNVSCECSAATTVTAAAAAAESAAAKETAAPAAAAQQHQRQERHQPQSGCARNGGRVESVHKRMSFCAKLDAPLFTFHFFLMPHAHGAALLRAQA